MTTIDEARAAVLYEAMLPPCEACKCVLADDPDRNECACDGSCCTDSEYIDMKIDAEARMYQVIERLIAAVREDVLREQPCYEVWHETDYPCSEFEDDESKWCPPCAARVRRYAEVTT